MLTKWPSEIKACVKTAWLWSLFLQLSDSGGEGWGNLLWPGYISLRYLINWGFITQTHCKAEHLFNYIFKLSHVLPHSLNILEQHCILPFLLTLTIITNQIGGKNCRFWVDRFPRHMPGLNPSGSLLSHIAYMHLPVSTPSSALYRDAKLLGPLKLFLTQLLNVESTLGVIPFSLTR